MRDEVTSEEEMQSQEQRHVSTQFKVSEFDETLGLSLSRHLFIIDADDHRKLTCRYVLRPMQCSGNS